MSFVFFFSLVQRLISKLEMNGNVLRGCIYALPLNVHSNVPFPNIPIYYLLWTYFTYKLPKKFASIQKLYSKLNLRQLLDIEY